MNYEQIVSGIEQGSDEWLALRAGCLSGSIMSGIVSKGKVHNDLVLKLACERITGNPISTFVKTDAMQRGNDLEQHAREAYEAETGNIVSEVTLVKHSTLNHCISSPDGLIFSENGGIEIKCRLIYNHLGFKLNREIPKEHLLQMQWLIMCAGLDFVDYVNYCPEIGKPHDLLIDRVLPDKEMQELILKRVSETNQEIEDLLFAL